MAKRRSVDLIGMTFGKLTVLEKSEDYIKPCGQHVPQWLCQCNCKEKNKIIVRQDHLKTGNTSSCGCLRMEKFLEKTKGYNDYKICGDYAIFYTSKGEEFYIDTEDIDKVKDICWHFVNGYLNGNLHGKHALLHRIVMDAKDGETIDHIGGEESRWDNRKSNLRVVTTSQNSMNRQLSKNNTSGTTGVVWSKKDKKWRSQIMINNKLIFLGLFKNKDDAIRKRKEAEKIYFKEYAYDASQQLYDEAQNN